MSFDNYAIALLHALKRDNIHTQIWGRHIVDSTIPLLAVGFPYCRMWGYFVGKLR